MSKTLVIKNANFYSTRLTQIMFDGVIIDADRIFAYVSNIDGYDYASFSEPKYEKITYADKISMDSPRLRLRPGSGTSNYYIAPHLLPSGASQVSIKANDLKHLYSCYVFFFASEEEGSAAKTAKMVQKIRQDATNYKVDFVVDVPEGADSVVIMVDMQNAATENDDPVTVAEAIGFEVSYI